MASIPEESAKAPAAAKSVPTPAAAAKSVPTPAATELTVFMPTKPKFGGNKEVYKDSFVPWKGGEPQGDWSGLANLTVEVELNQYRPTSATSAGKAQRSQPLGLTPPFEKSYGLQLLKMNVNQHMNKFGLFSLKYLLHPNNDTKVVNVINNHGLFDKKKGVANGNKMSTKLYDCYERASQRDGIMFLTNLIIPMLKLKLLQTCHDSVSFIAYWFTLIHIVRSTSVERFEEVKKTFKGRNIKKYQGEDVKPMSTDLHNGFTVLNEAAMYDQNMSVGMINSLLNRESMSNGRNCWQY